MDSDFVQEPEQLDEIEDYKNLKGQFVLYEIEDYKKLKDNLSSSSECKGIQKSEHLKVEPVEDIEDYKKLKALCASSPPHYYIRHFILLMVGLQPS